MTEIDETIEHLPKGYQTPLAKRRAGRAASKCLDCRLQTSLEARMPATSATVVRRFRLPLSGRITAASPRISQRIGAPDFRRKAAQTSAGTSIRRFAAAEVGMADTSLEWRRNCKAVIPGKAVIPDKAGLQGKAGIEADLAVNITPAPAAGEPAP